MLFMVLLLVLAFPTAALAQEGDDKEDNFNLRINGNYHVAAGESIDTVVVISGDALIEGIVNDALVVIDGRATIAGQANDLVVISGDLELRDSATVNDITLVRSDLVQAPGATVTGKITRTSGVISRGWAIVFGVLFWVGMTILVLVAGVVFAAVAGRQLSDTGALMGERPGPTILTGVVCSILFPIIAVIALITIVGIPLGITILVVVIPAIIFTGYIVFGTWLGSLILSRTPLRSRERPYAPALLGLFLLQLVVLIPGLGGGVFLVAAVWGGGTVVYRLWRGSKAPPSGPPPAETPPAPMEPASPA
jgi:hypothetical protein